MTEETAFRIERDRVREGMNKYTSKAFGLIPRLDRPSILDVGCGTGVPTMELARLSNGEIVALDIDGPALAALREKVEQAGLSERVKIVEGSMLEMDFPESSFDIIWAEGSIYAVGFEKAIKEWRRLLKAGGFLAVHDEVGDIRQKKRQISDAGYELIDYFMMGSDDWGNGYCIPLEKWVGEARDRYKDVPGAKALLDQDQSEINMFKSHPGRYKSVFFVIKKR